MERKGKLFRGLLFGGIFSLTCIVNGETAVESFWNESIPDGDVSLNGEPISKL